MKSISTPDQKTKDIFKEVTGQAAPFALVVHWPWFYKSWIGLTIGFVIFSKKPDDIAHLCHELVHVNQFYQQPWSFWFKYISERRRVGYWNNPYEKAAYAVQYKAESALRREAYRMQVKSKA